MIRLALTSCLAVALWASPRRAAARTHTLSSTGDTSPSEKALAAAQARWQALKGDAKRSRLRCNWTKLTSQLDRVAEKYPHSPEAPAALLAAGQASEDLAHASFLQDDFGLAATAYQRVTAEYAGTPQSEEAHEALIQIYRHKLHQDDKAREEVAALAEERHPHHGSAARKAARAKAQAMAEAAVEKAKPAAAKAEPKIESAAETKAPEASKVDHRLAEVTLPVPIVAPEATGGMPASAAPVADPMPAPTAEAALYKPSEIVVGKQDPEQLDKGRLAALKSAVRISAEMPLSAQMGLKVRRVVIDAGHGGHDTGAIGPSGVKEKDVSLAVAKRLAEKLRLQGLEVLLTRSDDRFISLEGRTAFANENRADLFVSVHCNAATDPKLHGVETYSLNVSSNQYAMRLAARENATSSRSISDLQYLLADLTTKANTTDSRHLAHLVQSSVTAGLREKYEPIRDLGTKEALFYVLMGTRMPAILVEGSFISNPSEEHRLTDVAYQDQLAGSVAAGVARFVDERQSLGGTPVAGLP